MFVAQVRLKSDGQMYYASVELFHEPCYDRSTVPRTSLLDLERVGTDEAKPHDPPPAAPQ